MGIEPTPSAWEAEVLPLYYTRVISAEVIMAKAEIGCKVCKYFECFFLVRKISQTMLVFTVKW